MPAPSDPKLRQIIVKAYESGLGTYETVAEPLGVERATVSHILKLACEAGSVSPKPRAGGRPPPIVGRDIARVESVVRSNPCATLEELADL